MSIVRPQAPPVFPKPPREFKARGPGGFPIGERTRRRQRENRELAKLDIRQCEIRIPGICLRNKMLTWAHSKKSRFLVTKRDWQEAARSCLTCHQHIEAAGHTAMRAIVLAAIRARKKS